MRSARRAIDNTTGRGAEESDREIAYLTDKLKKTRSKRYRSMFEDDLAHR
jgi:hypothetical protein